MSKFHSTPEETTPSLAKALVTLLMPHLHFIPSVLGPLRMNEQRWNKSLQQTKCAQHIPALLHFTHFLHGYLPETVNTLKLLL